MNSLKQYCEEAKIELLYFIICLIYLVFLNEYNRYLLTKYEENDYIHMLFENTEMICLFFVLAIIIVAVAIYFICRRKNLLKNYWSYEEENVAVSIISIIFNILVIVMVILAINNPILQCILFGTMMLFALASQ